MNKFLSFLDFLLKDVRLSSLHCVFEKDGVSLYFDGVVSDKFISHLFNATNKFSLTFSMSASDNFVIVRVY